LLYNLIVEICDYSSFFGDLPKTKKSNKKLQNKQLDKTWKKS